MKQSGTTFHFYGFHHSKRPITTGTPGINPDVKITSNSDSDYNLGDTDFGQFIGDRKRFYDGTAGILNTQDQYQEELKANAANSNATSVANRYEEFLAS